MTQLDDQASPVSPPATDEAGHCRPGLPCSLRIVTLLAIFFFAIVIWFNLQQSYGPASRKSVQSIVQDSMEPGRRQDLEQKIAEINERMNGLNTRLEKVEQTTVPSDKASAEVKAPSLSEEDLARLKSDVVSLSSALGALQTQVKQSVQNADQTRNAGQATLATVVALTQLRAVTSTGGPFTRELQALRQVAGSDGTLLEFLTKLEPTAANGVPSLPMLSEEFLSLIGSAQAALNKAGAQTWQERVMAELQGLVSIRPLHPTTNSTEGSLDSIAKDLGQHQLESALTKVVSLPEPAQTVLKEWREKAEKRQNLDATLNSIATHLVSRTQNIDSPSAVTIPVVP